MVSLLDAALEYARSGIQIAPLWPRSKEPLRGFGNDQPSSDEIIIRYWWDRCPQANIGIPTGKKYNSLVIALENSYIHRYENFKIWKYSHPQKITSNLSKTFKYTILKAFYIDESSFNTNSQYIILFSLIENIIHISTNSTIFIIKRVNYM